MILIIVLLVIAVILAVSFYLSLCWLFTEMAKRNIIFTLRTEGEIKAIMRGDRCARYVMAVENHIIDPDDSDIYKGSFQAYANELAKTHAKKKDEDPTGFKEKKLSLKSDGSLKTNSDESYELNKKFKKRLQRANPISKKDQGWIELLFGVVWIGFPPYRVFSYQFRWIKYAQEKLDSGTPSERVIMQPRNELVDSLYFRYPVYGIVADDAETGAGSFGKVEGEAKGLERIKLRLELVMETETANPQKTLFRTAGLSSAGDWLSAISKEIRDAVRKWVGQVDYDTLIKDKTGVVIALNRICEEVNGVKNGNRRKIGGLTTQTSAVLDYGQKILKISLVNMDLKDKELQKSIDAIFNAEQRLRMADKEAKRLITLAKGQQAEAAASLKGKAEGLRDIAAITGGQEMYTAEQLGNINVYAPGQDKVFLNVATGVTGNNSPLAPGKNESKKGDV